jgi:hypothetical protein
LLDQQQPCGMGKGLENLGLGFEPGMRLGSHEIKSMLIE